MTEVARRLLMGTWGAMDAVRAGGGAEGTLSGGTDPGPGTAGPATAGGGTDGATDVVERGRGATELRMGGGTLAMAAPAPAITPGEDLLAVTMSCAPEAAPRPASAEAATTGSTATGLATGSTATGLTTGSGAAGGRLTELEPSSHPAAHPSIRASSRGNCSLKLEPLVSRRGGWMSKLRNVSGTSPDPGICASSTSTGTHGM